MRKLRLFMTIVVAGLAFNACAASPTGLQDEACVPEVQDCSIKPTGH